ncbi:cupin domain-containing protein [Streptacidiphilus fuscans]|uniref:Cupin domain-containing protein n=1 Tax=Streptacidiphilus fuscans TaxID=2789292 RepID=A0A931BD39_9ACTN|nr:cupin domain-containing protein [Streptacidiphilus fuscans]MBF9072008.1 cupin domain-containing protein [Streptacidiphilus fuscans]
MATETDQTVPPLNRVVVLDQKLPEPLTVERVEIRRITIAAGHTTGLHIHNGPVFGTIESGTALYQIEGEAPVTLGPGDVFYEPQDVRIATFEPVGDSEVVFFAFFPLAAGIDASLVLPEA